LVCGLSRERSRLEVRVCPQIDCILSSDRSAPFLWPEAVRIRRVSSELPIRVVKRNRAFEFAARTQNTNFTCPKARAVRHSRWPDVSPGTQAQRPELQRLSSPNGAV
jgi:hypothetical protein